MKSTRSTILVAGLAIALVVVGFPIDHTPQASATVRVADIDWQRDGNMHVSELIDSPLTTLGMVWSVPPSDTIWFRTKSAGSWSPWQPLPVEDDHGPDPGTIEHENSIPGSDPLWVGESDAVQFRTSGLEPSDARAVLIDTGAGRAPSLRTLTEFLTGVPGATGAVAAPLIRPRSDWDPTGSCPPRVPPDEVQITHFFVHHTTGSNSYTASQVPGRILSICLFHRDSRGWNDIAYNFLIDKYGQIWEGRAGGIDRGIQGAHTAGFSTYSMGVAFLGDHKTSRPTPAAENALEQLIAWKASVHNVDVDARTTVVSKGSDKWERGTPVSLHAISGHIDAQVTSCPGEACYQRLPVYRQSVAAAWRQIPLSTYRSPLVGDFDRDGADEAAVFRTTDGVWSVTSESGSTSAWADFYTNSGWSSQIVGDFDGDGRDDIANFHPSNGTWWVSRSTGTRFTTTLWADFSTPNGWSIQLVGDFDGDGRDDITNRHRGNGTWWTVLSRATTFSSASFWGEMPSLDHVSHAWPQDVDADGRDDVLAIDAYNGFIRRGRSSGGSFDVSTLIDTPWRTTVGGDAHHRTASGSGWLFFGQEFQWIRLGGLDSPGASAEVSDSLPRP